MSSLAPGRSHDSDWHDPVEIVNAAGRSDLLLLCEHASNHMPSEYARLGVSPADMERHIAWDPGAAAVTRRLAALLDAPAFLGTHSRLLIDLNRPLDVDSSICTLSENTPIPGNVALDGAERDRRADLLWHPFHDRIARTIDDRAAAGRLTRIAAIHSFTPIFRGQAREWRAGILFAAADGYAHRVITSLEAATGFPIGENQPYSVSREEDYGLLAHGDDRGNPAILVEIRNDELAGPEGVERWAQLLAAALG